MIDEMNMLDEIISLTQFSTVDSILFHHNVAVHLIFLIWSVVNLIALFRVDSNNKPLSTFVYFNVGVCGLLMSAFLLFGDINSIEKRTELNEKQINLLKTIYDPKLIQVINYSVAEYGPNLYAIDRSLSKTEITLSKIEKAINPPKFLEFKTN